MGRPARDGSTGACSDDPRKLLVVGGSIIGLEMACVYDALGAVTVVELLDQLARRRPGSGAATRATLDQALCGIHQKFKEKSNQNQRG
jgi:dihydrolipoamide dehydrogenase